MNYMKGSEWRKWDLHLHTKSSYDYDYKATDADELLCNSLRENQISAAVITDHFKIDAQRINHLKELAPEIVFFPGVELRIDKCGANTHLILIFSEKSNFIELQNDFDAIMYRGKAKQKDDDRKIFWNFSDVVDFAREHNALISIHAGSKTNGIDKITNAIVSAEAIKEDIAQYIDFFEIGKQEDISSYNNIVFKSIKRRPLIIGSDNHDPRSYRLKENLWFKCDLTFEGLRQVCIHPQERVYIGKIPPHLESVQSSPFHYISEIKIFPQETKDKTIWFDSTLALNSGLVAIIGNKGSGKSALTDSLALAAGSRSMGGASFLNKSRFKSEKANYAKNYMVQIKWADGRVTEPLCLDDSARSPEYVEYLPQSKIEKICNELNNEFQGQIDEVIFSYIPEEMKSGFSSLEDLLDSRNKTIDYEISKIRGILDGEIKSLCGINLKRKPSYRKELDSQKKYLTEQLESHLGMKPQVVGIEQSSPNTEKLSELNKEISKAEETIEKNKSSFGMLKGEIQRLHGFKKSYQEIIKETKEKIIALLEDFSDCSLDKDKFMPKIQFNIEPIDDLIIKKEKETFDLEDKRKELEKKLDTLHEEREKLLTAVSEKEKEYQEYLERQQTWELRLKEVQTQLDVCNKEIDYIENSLPEEHIKTQDKIVELMLQIYDKICEKVTTYNEIYYPVGEELNKFLSKLDDKIEFVSSINISPEFASQLLRYVNQKLKSPLMGIDNGFAFLENLCNKTDFNSKDSVRSFIEQLIILFDSDCKDSIDKVLNTQEDYYKFLTSMIFLQVRFELKLDDNSLAELSPGQRGSVLLVFYLALSRDKKPLIIDQPEDNLDNQSIYNKLVPCVLEAKKHRQIFLVTHNPNLAIACDAEQIVYCQLNDDAPKIRYCSGSIENQEIKAHVIDVLEGTEPAFTLRKHKYNI